MINLHRLRILMELQRQGTLAEVAAELGYTPSAISQQLNALEREVGTRLLERVGRNVRLTDAAVTLTRHGAAIFAAVDEAESDLASLQGPVQGSVRVASFSSVLLSLAPQALTHLSSSFPDLEVQLIQREVDEAQEGLLSHAFDLVLGEEFPGEPMPSPAGLQREDLYSDPLRLVAPTSIDGLPEPEHLSEFHEVPWSAEPKDSRMGRWVSRLHGRANIAPRIICETLDPLLLVQMARTGQSVSIIPGVLGAEYLSGVALFDLPGNPTRNLYTEVRAGRDRHPALVAVREAFAHAADQFRTHPSTGALAW
ncbi:LysR substrate binding domain protein [Brevibacterium mcbrellneri ATCC 49030]|uniref:LysR substrate binding domain protein n=1 Tax=Brevibacterium mcbrellneri ATCC 49030 TaxID=585530 RepID=D4YLJ1_9MICO|nr:LysR family transcriptional regulator [Brevibacterium mcbrellneri]EFG47908.1 LysR substrate binding domain protein [Brevibacterium mcbrellneri ATCC 49030]